MLIISYLNYGVKDYIYLVLSFGIVLCLFVIAANKRMGVVDFLDDSCMGIYLMNQIVIFYLLLNESIRGYLSLHNYLGPLIIITISFFLPLFITKILKRFRWSSYILG